MIYLSAAASAPSATPYQADSRSVALVFAGSANCQLCQQLMLNELSMVTVAVAALSVRVHSLLLPVMMSPCRIVMKLFLAFLFLLLTLARCLNESLSLPVCVCVSVCVLSTVTACCLARRMCARTYQRINERPSRKERRRMVPERVREWGPCLRQRAS